VELHTGAYAHAFIDGDEARVSALLERIVSAADAGARMGLEIHAGHGLTFDNVAPIAAIPGIAELNIGHFLIGEAIFSGLDSAVRRMRALMDQARGAAGMAA
jgi:pyridoxine 5-phosphate synthase